MTPTETRRAGFPSRRGPISAVARGCVSLSNAADIRRATRPERATRKARSEIHSILSMDYPLSM